jgi:hypothetical protein
MNTASVRLTQHASQRLEQRRVGREGLRAALLFGDRFSQADGTVIHLVTRRAAALISTEFGLPAAYVDNKLRGVYLVMTRLGAVITVGRRYKGTAGRIRRG